MAFHHRLTDKLVISKKLDGTDDFGGPLFGPKETHPAAIDDSSQKVRDVDGNERVSAMQVATSFRIGLEDKVWLLPEGEGAVQDDEEEDDEARLAIAIRNGRSRVRGFRFYQTFY